MISADSTFSFILMNIDYDERSRELVIAFRGGKTAVYSAVPPSVYRDLMNSEARGGFFLDHIRDAYPCMVVPSQRRA